MKNEAITLDEKDHSIIKVLREDSRKPIRDIAKITGIRPSTVHQRITLLRKKKVIEKFTVKLNNKALGEDFIVFVLFNSNKDLDSEFTSQYNIKELYGVTGEYDLIMKLRFKDVSEFNDFIINFRKTEGAEKH